MDKFVLFQEFKIDLRKSSNIIKKKWLMENFYVIVLIAIVNTLSEVKPT